MHLVIGATGNVGNHVVHDLLDHGARVRAFVRDAAKAGDIPDGVEIAVGDLTDQDSLLAAAQGVEGVFFMQTNPDPTQAQSMVEVAHRQGVHRIVVLSSAGTVLHPLPVIGARIAKRDAVFQNSDLEVTYLRANGLMSNALGWKQSIADSGSVTDATYPGVQAVVDPADVAMIAAIALTHDGHAGHGYVLTGPEAIDAKQQVQTLSDVLGRAIDFVAETPEEGEQSAVEHGVAAEMAAAMRNLNELFAASRAGIVTDDVQNVAGVAPRTFQQWCEDHADAFAS